MVEDIIRVLIGIFLIIVAIQDLVNKKIKVWIVLLSGIIISICVLLSPDISILSRIMSLSLGTGLLIISKVTGGKIGIGDGLVICVTGIGFGFWTNMELFALALLLAALFSIGLLVFKLADKKKSIPFLPFLFLSYLIKCIPIWS
ncbi:MAG: hypothetical protein GX321_05950 [Clostridiales bacterium]|nr:hypothetical protein [Clostridiales bacterium]